MKQMRVIVTGLILMMIFSVPVLAEGLPPISESRAFQLYRQRSQTELSKLIYLLDRYRNTDYLIHYEGRDFDSRVALQEAKKYLATHYANESATRFIEENAYRPKGGSGILYLKTPKGDMSLLKDVLLSELKALETVKS